RRPGGGRVGQHLAAPADHPQRRPQQATPPRWPPHDRLRPELKGATMHVLPLPFGLALALIPRREADKIRAREEIRPILRNTIKPREQFLGDVRSLYLRDHV